YFGSGKAAGGSVRLYLKLQDAAAGETIASVSQTRTEDRLFDLVSRTASDVRTRLGVADASSAELEGVKASIATIRRSRGCILKVSTASGCMSTSMRKTCWKRPLRLTRSTL